MNASNMVTLEKLKDAFTSLVGSAEPSILPAFLMWVDIKVAEYKCSGYMFTDNSRQYDSSTWSQYPGDKQQTSNKQSQDTTSVQTEALELTKSQEKKQQKKSDKTFNKVPHYSLSSVPQDRMYSKYQDTKPHDIAYPKDVPSYNSHLSPVYGSEACGINLSMKSSHGESPLKLTLKVPSIYQNASSPEKTTTASPEHSPIKKRKNLNDSFTAVDEKINSSISADTYSSLRSLLQASRKSEPSINNTVPVNAMPSVVSSLTPSQLCVSPIKSDTDSTASSPGPADMDIKDHKKTDCPYCGKKFQYRSSFRRHMKIHQGIYTHICAACSRKFTRKEHFVRHKCNRKPNIPNRSATRVEMTPETMLPSSKLPQPKVAYPPTLDDSKISSFVAAELNSVYKSAHAQVDSNPVYPGNMIFEQPTQSIKIQTNGFESDGSNSSTVPKANESRRKKAMPRKVVTNEVVGTTEYMDDEDDVLKAYDSPVATPITIAPIDEPSSPEDHIVARTHYEEERAAIAGSEYSTPLRQVEYPHTEQVHYQHSSLPMEIAPKEGLSADTISTETGTYQIEQCQDEAIKVTKQSNYLKLRKEAQMINGQMCFVCPHCSKVFHRSSNFSRHMRIHRGVFSYICPACNRGFYRKEHFQKHKCTRKSMTRVWSRKTKLEMEAEAGATVADELIVPREQQPDNRFVPEGIDDRVLEEGVDLGSDDYGDESAEEGSLIVDETPTQDDKMDLPTHQRSHTPPNVPQQARNLMATPPILTVGGN